MKRKIILMISRCRDCPYLDSIDYFSSHRYICQASKITTNEYDTDTKDTENELKELFEKKCLFFGTNDK